MGIDLAIIDIKAGFEELRLIMAQISRDALSGGCDKLALALLDVSQPLSEEFPAPLRLFDGQAALLKLIGDREQVNLLFLTCGGGPT